MKSSKISEYKDIIDSVFEMSDGEMSYPIELSDQNQIFLISLNKIHYSRQESLNEVENKIIDLLQKREVVFANIKHLENIRKDYNTKKLESKDKSINILRSQSFTREESLDSNKFPAELLNAIFLGKNASSTPITVANGKAYFAYIKSIKLSGKKIKELKNNSEPYLKDSIKHALFEELITHLGAKNNMRILKRDLNSISD